MTHRSTLGRAIAVALSIAVSQAAVPVAWAAAPDATSHVLARNQIDARLAERAALRASRVQAVEEVLAGPAARREAGSVGVSVGKLRAAVPHLSDSELADLAARAAQVKDVAAGHHTDDGLVILGIVLLIAGVVVLAATSYDDYYDGCGCY